MDKIIIEGTRKTPSVMLDPAGILKIEGRSIPEDAKLFFNDIVDWIKNYVSSPGQKTTIDIAFEYLNSGTSKYILEILTILKELIQKNHPLTVNWYYEEGDDDILERGEYYSSILDIKLNFIETE
jgi:hypothetical protein